MNFANESDAKEFIIGTENSIVTHLQMSCPDKMFYPLSKDCVCHNMKATTLVDVLKTTFSLLVVKKLLLMKKHISVQKDVLMK